MKKGSRVNKSLFSRNPNDLQNTHPSTHVQVSLSSMGYPQAAQFYELETCLHPHKPERQPWRDRGGFQCLEKSTSRLGGWLLSFGCQGRGCGPNCLAESLGERFIFSLGEWECFLSHWRAGRCPEVWFPMGHGFLKYWGEGGGRPSKCHLQGVQMGVFFHVLSEPEWLRKEFRD